VKSNMDRGNHSNRFSSDRGAELGAGPEDAGNVHGHRVERINKPEQKDLLNPRNIVMPCGGPMQSGRSPMFTDAAQNRRLIIIVIIIGLLITGCVNNNNTNNVKRFSAMDGLSIANNIAQEWRNASTLYRVATSETIDKYGKATKWLYECQNKSETGCLTSELDVTVSSDFSYRTYESNSTYIFEPIQNWTIDSDNAVIISRSDKRVDQFFKMYPMTIIQQISIDGEHNESSGCQIMIEYIYPGLSPIPLRIFMDGNSGKILDIIE